MRRNNEACGAAEGLLGVKRVERFMWLKPSSDEERSSNGTVSAV
jgi:hypothetical protein